MAGKQKDKERVFNISVVGLSGTDKDKGSCGVGKSCLCNRFVRPEADDYHKEHICVISQSDFSGRVVNNDHFLYWGEKKINYEGQTYSFRIIEQTEFIDDSSFQPFRGNNTGNYLKRCMSSKIGSQDKLMYLFKDQLGDEDNFEKITFTNGKITVDGFLVVYDSSIVRGRDAEKQIEFLTSLYSLLKRNNKPFVCAVTKCDEADEYNMREIEKFGQKHRIPLIETSANEAVNVELAFVTLVQMVDKSRGTGRRVAYLEANKHRKVTIDRVTDSYCAILKDHVTNYHLKWDTMKRFEKETSYKNYIFHLGTRQAKKRFDSHIKMLKTEHQRLMLAKYLISLPNVFEDIFPDLGTIGQRSWTECKQYMESHERYDSWFILLDGDWQEHKHINQTTDNRIPASLFSTHDSDCESQFNTHINKLYAAKKKERMQSDFRKLLEASKVEVMAGKQYKDVIKHFRDEESFLELNDEERLQIYSSHQEEITRKSKNNFKELLFECADVFVEFDEIKLSHTHLLDIQDKLQSYARYCALEFLHNERHALLIKHLAFIQHPTPETCISGMHCMDLLIKGHVNNSVHRTSPPSLIQSCDDEFQKLSIVILGQDGLAEELLTVIESQCCDGEYTLDGTLHNLQLRALEGDVSQPQNALKTDEFNPAACICTFSGRESFEYIKSSLESTILNQECDSKDLRKLPVIFVFARGVLVEDDEHNEIKEEALTMFTSLSSTEFVDMPRDDSMLMRGNKFHEQQIQQAIRAILTSTHTPNPHEQVNGQGMETLKIGLCVMCGDEHTVEHVLSPFVKNDLCYRTPQTDFIFNVVTYIDDKRAKVEIRASSYHGATKYALQCNGLILFYSPKRKGSFETMKNFAIKHDFLPIKIVAVCDSDKAVQHFELTKSGEEFASKIDAGFMITGADFGVQTEVFTPFFHDVMVHTDTDSSSGESDQDDMINRPQLAPPESHVFQYPSDGRKNLGTKNIYATVTKPKKLWSPFSRNDEPPEPVYDVVGPTIIYDDPHADQQRPKHVPPPVKPSRIFSDQGLNPYPFDDGDYKEEENPIYIAASTTKHPPPVKPKPTIRQKPQPRKLDLHKFSAVEKAVGNNHSPRKFSANKAPNVMETRTSSGKKRNPTTPLSPNGNFLMELQKTINKDPKEDPFVNNSDSDTSKRSNREITNENVYDVVSIQSNDDKESIKRKKEQKKKHQKQKEDQDKEAKRQKQRESKSKKKKMIKTKILPPQVKRPPIEECVTGDETVPQFVIKCVEFLEEEGICQEGIYRIPGKGADSELIVSTFAKNPDMNLFDMHMSVPAVCTALKQFFSKLPEPLIPYNLQKEFLENCTGGSTNEASSMSPMSFHFSVPTNMNLQSQEEQTQAINILLEKMPLIKRETLKYMMLHLNKIMEKRDVNRMTSQNLAVCWWPTLLHPEYKSLEDMANDAKLSAIVENLISKAIDFFEPIVEELPVPEVQDMETESDSSQQPLMASSSESYDEFLTQ